MANTKGFRPPEYTMTPNRLFDELLPELGYAELKVLLCLFRETFGWHRPKCRMSIKQIARATGLSTHHAFDAGAALVERGLVLKVITLGESTEWEVITLCETQVSPVGERGIHPDKSKSPVKEIKEIKRKEREPLALDFVNMTVIQARQLPTLRMYARATDWFPGSMTWEFVHNFITDNKLTEEKIKEAATAWALAGFKSENVKGILEWTITGIPEKHKTQITKPSTGLHLPYMRALDDDTPIPFVEVSI